MSEQIANGPADDIVVKLERVEAERDTLQAQLTELRGAVEKFPRYRPVNGYVGKTACARMLLDHDAGRYVRLDSVTDLLRTSDV